MTHSTSLRRGALTLTLLATLAACGGGGGGSRPSTPNPPTPVTRTIGGTVSGLSGSGLVLRNNGGDNLTITGNGAFTFATSVSDGGAYAVTALSQPTNPSQTCTITNGGGNASANVTSVAVTCATDTFNVTATVTGLTGTGLILGNNADRVTANSNATFSFDTPVASGARYNVVVESAPTPAQRCTVADGNGIVGNADVEVAVTCAGTFPTFAHGLNTADGTLTSYLVDATTGQLRPRMNVKTGDSPVTALTYKPANGKQFSYVLNNGSDNISAFVVNARSGELNEVAGSPFATAGDAPTLLVLHPKLPVVYATNEGGASIAAFAINSNTGALTSLGTVATGTTPRSFDIDASGRFAYVAAPGSSELFTYAIDQMTGALSEVTSSRAAIEPAFGGVALERNGKYLYVFNPTPGSISAFALDSATGVPTALQGSPIAAGENIYFLGAHPNGKFIYAKRGSQNQNESHGIAVFALDAATGALSEIAGSPFDVSVNPLRLAIEPGGQRLYVSHLYVPIPQYQVRGYSIDSTTGALSPVAAGPVASPAFPEALTIDSTGKFVYASSAASDVLSAYRINAADGALSPLTSSPVAAGDQPGFIAVDEDSTPVQASSKFLYTTDAATDNIHTFAIAADGTLTAGGDIATADPLGITLDPRGRYAYAVAEGSETIRVYSVAAQNGALTEVASVPLAPGAGAKHIGIEPSGRYAYVSLQTTQQIARYTIDASTGGLSSVTLTNVGEDVNQLTVTPNGRWLLASTANSTNLHRYRIDSSNGDLLDHAAVPVGNPIDSLSVEASGRYVYLTSSAAGALYSYEINSQSGVLSLGYTYNFAGGSSPVGVAAHTSGDLVFTADRDGNAVNMFLVEWDGDLIPLSTLGSITQPIALTTDYSGQFVYVVTSAGQLHTLRIDRDTDTLTVIDTEVTGAAIAPGTIVTSSHTE